MCNGFVKSSVKYQIKINAYVKVMYFHEIVLRFWLAKMFGFWIVDPHNLKKISWNYFSQVMLNFLIGKAIEDDCRLTLSIKFNLCVK